jgi:hypothetical protein
MQAKNSQPGVKKLMLHASVRTLINRANNVLKGVKYVMPIAWLISKEDHNLTHFLVTQTVTEYGYLTPHTMHAYS